MDVKPNAAERDLRIGVLGASQIAPQAIVDPASRTPGVVVVSIAARDRKRAEHFARKHGIPEVESTYESVISSDVDAVYIALPASAHSDWASRVVEAGKHVLVEKPFALSLSAARAVIEDGRMRHVVVAEAFHYWYHPLTQRVLELVRAGGLGAVRHVDARFVMPTVPTEWRVYTDPALGGGALMHLACYPLHLVRSIVGEVEVRRADAEVGPSGVDESIRAELVAVDGATALIVGSMVAPKGSVQMSARIELTAGELYIENFVVPHLSPRGPRLLIKRPDGEVEIESFAGEATYWYQLQSFVAAALGEGSMHTSGDDTIGQARAMDATRDAAGLTAVRPR